MPAGETGISPENSRVSDISDIFVTSVVILNIFTIGHREDFEVGITRLWHISTKDNDIIMNKLNTKLAIGIAGTLSLFSCSRQTEKQAPPNVIIILADDMGYSDISCFGSEISTPNIDRLASEGMILTRFTNAGRCCPSRASLLTGLYPHQAGMGGMADVHYDTREYQDYLSDQAVTIAELLKLKGYNTYFSGKWHLGDKDPHIPSKRGFDHSFAFLNGATSYYTIKPYRDSSWLKITGSIDLKMLYDGKDYTPPAEGTIPRMPSPTKPSNLLIPEGTAINPSFFISLTMHLTGPFTPRRKT